LYTISDMYVRIKKRAIRNRYEITDYSLRFVVVESYRHKSGPRQRFVKYLGSIRASELVKRGKRHEWLNVLRNRVLEMDLDAEEEAKLSISLIRCVVHGGDKPFHPAKF